MTRRTAAYAGLTLVLVASAFYASHVAESGAASAAADARAPIFEVDPFWPKPLPNHWVLGSTIGVSVDAQDHVWIIHRPEHRGGQLQGRHVHPSHRHVLHTRASGPGVRSGRAT